MTPYSVKCIRSFVSEEGVNATYGHQVYERVAERSKATAGENSPKAKEPPVRLANNQTTTSAGSNPAALSILSSPCSGTNRKSWRVLDGLAKLHQRLTGRANRFGNGDGTFLKNMLHEIAQLHPAGQVAIFIALGAVVCVFIWRINP